MPLQSQPVDVALYALNQSLPTTAGAVGRLRALNNAIAKKWETTQFGTSLKVEKRDGFSLLPTLVRDPTTGILSSKTLGGMSMLTSFGKRLVAICAAAPFVLSESAGCWESPPVLAPTQILTAKPIVNLSGVQYTPDSARISARTMHVWYQSAGSVLGIFGAIVDDDGTVIREPFSIATASGPAKIRTDGTNFWVVFFTPGGGGLLNAIAFNTNGVQLGSTSIAADASTFFDIAFNGVANTILAVQKTPAAGTFDVTSFFWNGAIVTATTNTVVGSLADTGRIAFWRNDTGDGNIYVGSVSGVSPNIQYRVAQVDAANTLLHTYPVAINQTTAPAEMTGFVRATGNKDVTSIMSFLDTTANAQLNYTATPQLNITTIFTTTFAGVSIPVTSKRNITLVSRPFLLNGFYHVIMYYQSAPSSVAQTNQVQQSTFYALNIDFGSTYPIDGAWENTTAFADWQTAASSTYYLNLTTPTVDASGGIHIALTYRATSFTATKVVPFGDTGIINNVPANTTGIKDYQIGPGHGQAVEFSNELFLPGIRAGNYAGGTYTDDGLPLIPELLSVVPSVAPGALTTNTIYMYVSVAEWTDSNGNIAYSAASTPWSQLLTGPNQSFALTGTVINVTNKTNIRISLYRNVIINGVQSTQRYKVTDDLNPLYNGLGLATWTFTDSLGDAQASVKQILYTDKSLLDRFPAPPFSVGCAAGNRVFLLGYDNALWFSGEKVEGEKIWFSPFQRILFPTSERIVQVQPLDNAIICIGERNSVFAVPILQLPDATGSTPIPQPQLLTSITHGCTGFADAISAGVIFSSTQGGVWLIGRDLRDRFIGAPVKDETDASPVVGITTDANQRTCVLLANGKMLVYDAVIDTWYVWTTGTTPALITTHKGAFALYDSTTVEVSRQTSGLVSDPHAVIITSFEVMMHLNGVRNFKRIWDMQFQGEYLGDHDLTIAAFFDDDFATTQFTYGPFTPPVIAIGAPYIFDLPPKVEECSSIMLRFTDAFPRGASKGFSLEKLACEFAMETGLARLTPSTKRIAPI